MQQINLYQLIRGPVHTVYSARHIVLIWGVFFIGMFFTYLVNLYLRHSEYREIATITETFRADQSRLLSTASKYHIFELAQELVDPQKLIACKTKFSDYLLDLANAIPSGVWLTNINLSASGSEIKITGKALQSSLIQTFIDRLRLQPVLKNKPLELQGLSNTSAGGTAANEKGVLSFVLITKPTKP